MKITTYKVESTNISHLAFQNGTMFVLFTTGELYSYFPVSSDLFKRFLESESKGKFLAREIKTDPEIRYQRIDTQVMGLEELRLLLGVILPLLEKSAELVWVKEEIKNETR